MSEFLKDTDALLVASGSPALKPTLEALAKLRTQLAELPSVEADVEAHQAELDRVHLESVLAKQEAAAAALLQHQHGPLSKRRRTTLIEGSLLAEDLSRINDRRRRAYKEFCLQVRAWMDHVLRYDRSRWLAGWKGARR